MEISPCTHTDAKPVSSCDLIKPLRSETLITTGQVHVAGEVTTFAGLAETSGIATGCGAHARFNYPAGLAVDGYAMS